MIRCIRGIYLKMKIINSESKVRIYLLSILGLSLLYYILCIVVKNDFFQSVVFYDMDNMHGHICTVCVMLRAPL